MTAMGLTKSRIETFQTFIFDWWKTHKRDLPWRHTHDPYKIFVSEVMLQQTQVSRVFPKYKEFLHELPTVTALSHAPTSQVLKLWKGMGYNRRALYLKKAAEIIVHAHGGVFPKSEKDLLKLPGLGMYTARAIQVFAYRRHVAMVDTNIRKIITRFFFDDKKQKESAIQRVADRLVPAGRAWEWHQALMDYGAVALPKRSHPKESRGPVQPFKETDMYYRGRIMDLLRERKWKERTLISLLIHTYAKSAAYFRTLLTALTKEGLVTRVSGTVELPL